MSELFFECRAIGNKLSLFGDLKLQGFPGILAKLFQITRQAGYGDVVLDCSNVTSINPSVMAPLASYITYLRQEFNIYFELIEPNTHHVKQRFKNFGMAYYIEPKFFRKRKSEGAEPLLTNFRDHDQQIVAVDKVLNSVLRTSQLNRSNLKAIEWAVNEITDNVLTHANSKVGGFLIHSKVPGTGIIEFAVADSGIGISRSLGIANETEAVEQAVQEGVTRNKSTNQGNGLYGTFRLAQASNGIFSLKSKHGLLFVNRSGDVAVRSENVPYLGTYVVCQIDCDREDLISRALIFDNKVHDPEFDYLEKKHENFGDEKITVNAKDICKTFGSRKSGGEARNYILNVLENYQGKKLVVDFSDVNIVSSSYADEVFGKLFVQLGPMKFMRFLSMTNTCSEVEVLINRAIEKRNETGL